MILWRFTLYLRPSQGNGRVEVLGYVRGRRGSTARQGETRNSTGFDDESRPAAIHAGPVDVVDVRDTDGDPSTGIRRVIIGDCLVDLGQRDRVLQILRGHLGRPAGTGTLLVASANLDHVTHFGRSPHGDRLDPGGMDDWLVLLDGVPMVRAAHKLTGTDYPRLPGSDLLSSLLDIAEVDGRPVAFLGGRPELTSPLADALQRRWPSLSVVGHWTPDRAVLLSDGASRRLSDEIAEREPSLLVVGLGKPLQEMWLARHGRDTAAQVAVAFGAAIDFTAGTVQRAPYWMQARGLEWSYRLMREPRRMWRRYLVSGPPALYRIQTRTRLLALESPAGRPAPRLPASPSPAPSTQDVLD
jgi:N-acetylglucosaminyldiphosphoundecaprenol N-acetyl-beta-D-mannosaminyltransferase